MIYIILGVFGFVVIHFFDVVAIKRIRFTKPLIWLFGSVVFISSAVMACQANDKIDMPAAVVIGGWLLFPCALALFFYSLFINLPFKKTYIEDGAGKELVTTGLYALVRHPGLYGFALAMLALVLISRSNTMLMAACVWTAVDVILIVIQDRVFFGRMFPGYDAYRKTTPMLIPTWQSFARFFTDIKLNKLTLRRAPHMSQLSDLFNDGKYEDLWQRCCGFIDLSIEDFMRIQKRLLMEQLEMFKKCELGQLILGDSMPETMEEFRKTVPLTTYADYAPFLLKRRMDVLPRKPLLWQYTSGKSGEYLYRWVPVTARTVDEIEPLMFALMFFSSCKKRGEINVRKGSRVLYGMAPPPYATGTMARAFPNEVFTVLPQVEEAEQLSFEDRMKKGFEMGLDAGLDSCIAMSSIAVAIGQRFSQQGQEKPDIKALFKKSPMTVARLAKGMLKAKMAHRTIMPRDIWNLKSLITFGIDSSVFREKIKDMWGRYPLDFHGCTEAMIIAMQTWDYDTMTFVPHLNFFEFIPEKDALYSRADANYKPRILTMDELVPGNYELVITSFHGGPFLRYRLGHLVKIHALRNEKLNIDIPQMSFVARVDDQIDIAGFTRLGEKAIWQAVENTGLEYEDWVARKEVNSKPILHVYVELKGKSRYTAPAKVAHAIHEELKKIDKPYAELESMTGIHPLRVTLLPEGAFDTYQLRQQAAGASLSHLKPSHINPAEETVDFLVNTATVVKVHKTQELPV